MRIKNFTFNNKDYFSFSINSEDEECHKLFSLIKELDKKYHIIIPEKWISDEKMGKEDFIGLIDKNTDIIVFSKKCNEYEDYEKLNDGINIVTFLAEMYNDEARKEKVRLIKELIK